MSPGTESKRNNSRKGKKKRVTQTKENQPPRSTDTSVQSDAMTKPALDPAVPLSHVVNKANFTPLLDGERCILCHQERPAIAHKVDSGNTESDLGGQIIDKLPLWVCPECRRKVEEDEQRAGLNKPNSNDVLPDDLREKDLCSCYVCAGKRHLVPGKSKELQDLQFSWFEVKHFVRCAYREAGTALAADDKLRSTSLDVERIKRHTEKLTLKDPHQLYERLEAQAHEYLSEVREDLIKFLSTPFTNPLQHSKDCAATILDEYQSLLVALNILKPFMEKLESTYLENFDMTWEMLNKKVFCHEIFNDPIIQSSFPILIIQLRSDKPISSLNVPIANKPLDEAQASLLARFENFNQEMLSIRKLAKYIQLLKDEYITEKGGIEKCRTSENWESSLEDEVEPVKNKELCDCDNCFIASSPLLSGDFSSALSSSMKHVCSSSSSNSSASAATATYCARHAHNGGADHAGNLSSTQLLPTALFLNRCANSKCASCIREALQSFCFDQNAIKKCRHLEEEEKASLLSCKSQSVPHTTSCHGCDTHNDVTHGCRFHQHGSADDHLTGGRGPETASSIQSLLLSGTASEKCLLHDAYHHHHMHGHNDHKTLSEWDDDDDEEDEEEEEGGCGGKDGCEGHHHRGSTSPSMLIPGSNVNPEAPPSSPSSVRSNGDGSSCDTPTSRSSLSEDGRPNNGKYCDCCYCEFFGHGTPPAAQTSHNFVEMREKLRLRLKEKEKEREHLEYLEDHENEHDCLTDSRSVDELLTFINGDKANNETRGVKMSSKAAKRHRQKMKKAAEKGNHVIESEMQGCYRLRNVDGKDTAERPSSGCLEKARKCLKTKKSGKTALRETHEQNAKNTERSSSSAGKHLQKGVPTRASEHSAGKNCEDEKPARVVAKSGTNAPANAGNGDKRNKKRKEKHCAANQDERPSRRDDKVGTVKGQERRVIVNGNGNEAARYVEHTRGTRLPVREEAEPRHCGEERPPVKEVQNSSETPGKKSKARRKKKNASLDDVFLPKESAENGHSAEVDEAEREVEEFKRFCLSVPQPSRKLKLPASVNLKNLNLGSKK